MTWLRRIGLLLLIALVAGLPYLLAMNDQWVVEGTTQTIFRSSWLNVVLLIQIYIVLALGLNVVVGNTGLLDLGYASFMAIGAVVTCMGLMLTVAPDGQWSFTFIDRMEGRLPLNFEGSILLILLVAGLVGAVFGVLRGIPTLRLTGDYYAIVTLGVAEVLYEVFSNSEQITGGAFGISITRSQRAQLGGSFNWSTPQFYYLVLGTVCITAFFLARLNRSRLGRAWQAIRLDETAAAANGVNVASHKMIAFALSGFIGAVGGGLYALWASGVATKSIDVWQSILILCVLVLGGLGAIRGAVIGGAVLISLGELPKYKLGELITWVPGHENLVDSVLNFRVPPESRFLLYGLVLILMMRYRPQGLLPPRAVKTEQSPEELAERASKPGPLYHLSGGASA